MKGCDFLIAKRVGLYVKLICYTSPQKTNNNEPTFQFFSTFICLQSVGWLQMWGRPWYLSQGLACPHQGGHYHYYYHLPTQEWTPFYSNTISCFYTQKSPHKSGHYYYHLYTRWYTQYITITCYCCHIGQQIGQLDDWPVWWLVAKLVHSRTGSCKCYLSSGCQNVWWLSHCYCQPTITPAMTLQAVIWIYHQGNLCRRVIC